MSAPDLSPAFYDAWIAMAQRLNVDPYALARVSFAETGMYQRHPNNPNAGVWPFIESTLHRLGWTGTAQDFTAQPAEQQIVPWMENYLRPYAPYLRDDAMVYVAMFLPGRLPAAFNSDDSYVLTRAGDGTGFYESNRILDRNGDGVIDVGDLRRHMDIQDQGSRWETIKSELAARGAGGSSNGPNSGPSGTPSWTQSVRGPLALGLVALGAGGLAWYFYSNAEGVVARRSMEQWVTRLLP